MRTYIRADLSIEDFFSGLNDSGAVYVALRWFEQLPALDRGEDIDLLVSEDCLNNTLALTDRQNKKGVPLDIYSPSGKQKTDWSKTTVFPEKLSRQTLDNRVLGPNAVYRPSQEDYFLTLAYHAVFHKGIVSGLPLTTSVPSHEIADHDYLGILRELCSSEGMSPEKVTLHGLYDFFQETEFFPNPDMMDMIVRRNPWLAEVWREEISRVPQPWQGVSTFVIREAGTDGIDKIRLQLYRAGFFIAAEKEIEPQVQAQFSRDVRGGDWGRGPFPESGGQPQRLIVCFDPYPISPSEKTQALFPTVQNERESQAKNLIRQSRNAKLPVQQRANIVHSSDNALNARRYCQLVMDEKELEHVVAQIIDYAEDCVAPKRWGERMSTAASRAAFFAVSEDGQDKVMKFFKPDRLSYLQREKRVRSLLGERPDVVPILESGDNWFSMPRVGADDSPSRPFSPREIKAVISFVRDLRRLGVEAIDFLPHNIIRQSDNRLLFLDFEYFQVSASKNHLRGALAFFDARKGGEFELPMGYEYGLYRKKWLPALGVPRWLLVLDPPEFVLTIAQTVMGPLIGVMRTAQRVSRRGRKVLATMRGLLAKKVNRALATAVRLKRSLFSNSDNYRGAKR